MSTIKSKRERQTRPWWLTSRGRNKIWFGLFVLAAVVVVGGFAWLSISGGSPGGGEGSVPVGQQVEPFKLQDIASGRTVSSADYLGRQDVVIVGYMGFF